MAYPHLPMSDYVYAHLTQSNENDVEATVKVIRTNLGNACYKIPEKSKGYDTTLKDIVIKFQKENQLKTHGMITQLEWDLLELSNSCLCKFLRVKKSDLPNSNRLFVSREEWGATCPNNSPITTTRNSQATKIQDLTNIDSIVIAFNTSQRKIQLLQSDNKINFGDLAGHLYIDKMGKLYEGLPIGSISNYEIFKKKSPEKKILIILMSDKDNAKSANLITQKQEDTLVLLVKDLKVNFQNLLYLGDERELIGSLGSGSSYMRSLRESHNLDLLREGRYEMKNQVSLDDIRFIYNTKITYSENNAKLILNELNKMFMRYELNTHLRQAHFLAQVGEETGGLGLLKQNQGLPKNPSWYDYGRGLIHLTGKGAYDAYFTFAKLTSNAVNAELLATDPFHICNSAGYFWAIANHRKGYNENLNLYADKDDFESIFQAVNGVNGKKERSGFLTAAKKRFGL